MMTNDLIPKISIVTPSYNQSEFIAETIESVISQEGNFYLDYIIMDGGSRDGSVEIIIKYERLLQEGSWPVKCLGLSYRWFSVPDGGQADAINKGFSIAEGEILAWLNSDDIYCPSALERVVKIDWRWTDFCYGKGMWINREGDDITEYPTYPPNMHSLSITCTLCQPSVFLKKETYVMLGELRTNYDLVFDYEYWLRAVHARKTFQYIPSILAKSRMYVDNKTCSMIATGEKERKNLFSQYQIELSWTRRMLRKYWEIRMLEKTRATSENMMRSVFKRKAV